VSAIATCPGCGYTSDCQSSAQAAKALRMHSCDRHRARAAAKARRLAREAAMDRTTRPCDHPRANHQHGTHAAYVLDRCRCDPCRGAARTYENARTRERAYGRQAFVAAAPATEHLRALSAAGMGWKRAAAAAGLPSSVVYPLLYGRTDRRGGQPRTKARARTVEAILAVPMPKVEDLGSAALVDATGSIRRVRALIAIGWSVRALETRTGIGRQVLDHLATGHEHCLARTALAVRRVYDALWATAPAGAGSTRARKRAQANGWVPPLAWDDDTIDDPTALPNVGGDDDEHAIDHAAVQRALDGQRVRLTRAERWVVVERLARDGFADAAIARVVGTTAETVLRDRQRLGVESRWAA
jgi:hypothetical protein